MRRFTKVWRDPENTERWLPVYLTINLILGLAILGIALLGRWL